MSCSASAEQTRHEYPLTVGGIHAIKRQSYFPIFSVAQRNVQHPSRIMRSTMDQAQEIRQTMAFPFAEWMKSTTDVWTSLMGMAPAPTEPAARKDVKGRSAESWEAAMKTLQSLSSTLSEPETANAVFKGMGTLPDVFMKIAEATWDACFAMQKKNIERAGKIGQQVEAYQFESVDQELFRTLKEIYEQELRQFFYTPQLGLNRSYQERFNQFLDKLNLLQVVGAEFLSILYLPFEKSYKVLQQQLDAMAKEGKLPKETKEYYNMFIKILEGHYMTLFKSPEYRKTLSDLFNHLSEHIISKNEVLQDMLQSLPVPTYKEMDELYKDLHILKKRVKALEKQLSVA
jgi:polyhydroxyalkanoate synthase subunit PhaE